MPTCKDCVHVEVCRDFLTSEIGDENKKKAVQKYLSELENEMNINGCPFFKDRSKFVELQCKPGDVVYHYCEELHKILDYTVYCINLFRENAITYQADAYDEENDEALSEIGFEPEDIGRDVFLTRKEAEQALRKGEK